MLPVARNPPPPTLPNSANPKKGPSNTLAHTRRIAAPPLSASPSPIQCFPAVGYIPSSAFSRRICNAASSYIPKSDFHMSVNRDPRITSLLTTQATRNIS